MWGKTDILGPLLEVKMSKKCTPLSRKAHLEVKMLKNCYARTTFGNANKILHGRCKVWVPCRESAKNAGLHTFRKTMADIIYLENC